MIVDTLDNLEKYVNVNPLFGEVVKFLKENDVQTTFHYLPLHSSRFYAKKHGNRKLPNCDFYGDCLVRLPLYYELSDMEVNKIIGHIIDFCSKY